MMLTEELGLPVAGFFFNGRPLLPIKREGFAVPLRTSEWAEVVP